MDSNRFVDAMWLQACDMLDRADRLQRQFFQLGRSGRLAVWEPPVDLFESDWGLLIRAAVPDAADKDFNICLEPAVLRLTGYRRLPAAARESFIHRLEMPYGRIERSVALPEGAFELDTHSYVNGCLEIRLRRTVP
jgi:HSP20 family protein